MSVFLVAYDIEWNWVNFCWQISVEQRTWIIRYVNKNKYSFNLLVFRKCFCFAAAASYQLKPLPESCDKVSQDVLLSKTIKKNLLTNFEWNSNPIWTHTTVVEIRNVEPATIRNQDHQVIIRNSIHTLINIQSELFPHRHLRLFKLQPHDKQRMFDWDRLLSVVTGFNMFSIPFTGHFYTFMLSATQFQMKCLVSKVSVNLCARLWILDANTNVIHFNAFQRKEMDTLKALIWFPCI